MENSDKDINRLWVALEHRVKKVDECVMRLEHNVDDADVNAAIMAERVNALEREKDRLLDDVSYFLSQSMHYNLVLTGIPQELTNGNEAADVTERKLRQHLKDACKLPKTLVDNIWFERVRCTPSTPSLDKTRSIIAKFSFFKGREIVRKQWKALVDTDYKMFEQFPLHIVEKRKKLVSKTGRKECIPGIQNSLC